MKSPENLPLERLAPRSPIRQTVSLSGLPEQGKDVESFWKKHRRFSTCACEGRICLQDQM